MTTRPVAVTAQTTEVITEIAEAHSDSALWSTLAENRGAAIRRHILGLVAPGHLVDVYRLEAAGEMVGTRILRATLRVRKEACDALLRKSGEQGWFFRPLFRSEEERPLMRWYGSQAT